ncbi:hypothetical protein GMMP1_260024 [Candidatus Magnetomoraceae bacterium gMMP-1]
MEKKEDHYLLTVKNIMKTSGRYWDRIHLKTDSKIKPEFIISVYGKIDDASVGRN